VVGQGEALLPGGSAAKERDAPSLTDGHGPEESGCSLADRAGRSTNENAAPALSRS